MPIGILEVGEEEVDVGGGCGPVGDEADAGVVGAGCAPVFEGGVFAQLPDEVIGEGEELLVCRRVDKCLVTSGTEAVAQLQGCRDGGATYALPEVAFKERHELDSGDTAFGEESTVAFDAGEECGDVTASGQDNSLAEECAALCAADVESIGQRGDVAERDASFGGKTVEKSGAIEIERHVKFVADAAQRAQLVESIERTQLGGERDIDGSGLHHMGPCVIRIKLGYPGPDGFCREFAVGRRESDHLVAAGLDCARLMDIDVTSVGTDDSLPLSEEAVEDDSVGLCAARQEGNRSLVTEAASLKNQSAGTVGVRVVSVAGMLLKVCLGETTHNLGVTSPHIVTVEMKHKG